MPTSVMALVTSVQKRQGLRSMRLQVPYARFPEAMDGRFGCIAGALDMTWEAVVRWLIALHNMTGQFGLRSDDEARQIALDAIFLRAHHHLSRERIDEIKMRIGLEERLSKEEI
jgi:hypothetical protein